MRSCCLSVETSEINPKMPDRRGVGAGALGALLAPIFPVFTVLRSLESGLRGSLYRAGYELLYTGSRGHKACSQNSDRRRLRPRR